MARGLQCVGPVPRGRGGTLGGSPVPWAPQQRLVYRRAGPHPPQAHIPPSGPHPPQAHIPPSGPHPPLRPTSPPQAHIPPSGPHPPQAHIPLRPLHGSAVAGPYTDRHHFCFAAAAFTSATHIRPTALGPRSPAPCPQPHAAHGPAGGQRLTTGAQPKPPTVDGKADDQWTFVDSCLRAFDHKTFFPSGPSGPSRGSSTHFGLCRGTGHDPLVHPGNSRWGLLARRADCTVRPVRARSVC